MVNWIRELFLTLMTKLRTCRRLSIKDVALCAVARDGLLIKILSKKACYRWMPCNLSLAMTTTTVFVKTMGAEDLPNRSIQY